MDKPESRIRIELTDDQRKQIREASGQDISTLDVTGDGELDAIKSRLIDVANRERWLEIALAALDDARSTVAPAQRVQFSIRTTAVRSALAALEPVLDQIQSDLLAFETRYPAHAEAPNLRAGVDLMRRLVSAVLDGQKLPSMSVTEPPVACPGTSRWNGRGCATKPLPPGFHSHGA